MNCQEIIDQAKSLYLRDRSTVEPLWPDAELLSSLNWAHKKAADWGLLLRDDTDPGICFITLAAGQMAYPLDFRIVKIASVWLVWPDGTKTRLDARNSLDIDGELGSQWRWRPGQPLYYEPNGRVVNIAFPPSAEWSGQKIQFDVWRLPLADLQFSNPVLFLNSATGSHLPGGSVAYTTADAGIAPMTDPALPVPIDIIDPADGTTHNVFPFARPKTITASVSHATSIIPMGIALTGFDRTLAAISETITVTATGTAKAYQSAHEYAYVESITVSAGVDATHNTLSMGTADDTPEIDARLHDQLCYGVAHLAYLKNDADTENLDRSKFFYGKFTEVFGPEVSARTRVAALSRPPHITILPGGRRE